MDHLLLEIFFLCSNGFIVSFLHLKGSNDPKNKRHWSHWSCRWTFICNGKRLLHVCDETYNRCQRFVHHQYPNLHVNGCRLLFFKRKNQSKYTDCHHLSCDWDLYYDWNSNFKRNGTWKCLCFHCTGHLYHYCAHHKNL